MALAAALTGIDEDTCNGGMVILILFYILT